MSLRAAGVLVRSLMIAAVGTIAAGAAIAEPPAATPRPRPRAVATPSPRTNTSPRPRPRVRAFTQEDLQRYSTPAPEGGEDSQVQPPVTEDRSPATEYGEAMAPPPSGPAATAAPPRYRPFWRPPAAAPDSARHSETETPAPPAENATEPSE